jgi:hypothetical protein
VAGLAGFLAFFATGFVAFAAVTDGMGEPVETVSASKQ